MDSKHNRVLEGVDKEKVWHWVVEGVGASQQVKKLKTTNACRLGANKCIEGDMEKTGTSLQEAIKGGDWSL